MGVPMKLEKFIEEVRLVMTEYEIDDIEEAVEEAAQQLEERGAELGHIDLAAAVTALATKTHSQANDFTTPATLPRVQLPAPIPALCQTLGDPSRPIGMRMRALFFLRSVGGEEAIHAICETLKDKENNGSLLRHELAFVLGQMGATEALPVLEAVLRDTRDDAMTRHEAAEAIGAIALADTQALLEEFKADSAKEVADTCVLALDRMYWKETVRAEAAATAATMETTMATVAATTALLPLSEKESDMSLFNSVDPAPPLKGLFLEELEVVLNSPSERLFRRYGALFGLRVSFLVKSITKSSLRNWSP